MKTRQLILSAIAAAALMALAAGCSNQPAQAPVAESSTADDQQNRHAVEGHSHGEGPHDGTIADWGGGKYHVEFTVDHDKQEAAVYVLGSDEKTATPISAEEIQLSIKDPPMQVALKASPQEGDPEGAASRFVGNHEGLGVVQEYEGTIMGVVDDTPYSGNFKEVSHAH